MLKLCAGKNSFFFMIITSRRGFFILERIILIFSQFAMGEEELLWKAGAMRERLLSGQETIYMRETKSSWIAPTVEISRKY